MSDDVQQCQQPDCGRSACWAVRPTNEVRPDSTEMMVCNWHLHDLGMSVPTGNPWAQDGQYLKASFTVWPLAASVASSADDPLTPATLPHAMVIELRREFHADHPMVRVCDHALNVNSVFHASRSGFAFGEDARQFICKILNARRPGSVRDWIRRLHESSERAPDVRAVPMRLVRQDVFDELLALVGGAQ